MAGYHYIDICMLSCRLHFGSFVSKFNFGFGFMLEPVIDYNKLP